MENKKLIETLKAAGLENNEALVYLAALSLGPSTALKISQASGIKRTTVYEIIASLKREGLMAIEVRGLKRFFVAENPDQLRRLMDAKKELLKENLGQLAALYNLRNEEAMLKYYEGAESVKSTHEILFADIRPGEEYLVVSNEEHWLALDENYFKRFMERRAKLPIITKVLLEDSPAARRAQKFQKNYNYRIKLLPQSSRLTTNLVVTPEHVVIHQLVPPILSIVIDNRSVIQTHREMFAVMWNSIPDAKPDIKNI